MVNNQRRSQYINMVHRIQNRNPGYSDFIGMKLESFNIQTSTHNPISEGATALKLRMKYM